MRYVVDIKIKGFGDIFRRRVVGYPKKPA